MNRPELAVRKLAVKVQPLSVGPRRVVEEEMVLGSNRGEASSQFPIVCFVAALFASDAVNIKANRKFGHNSEVVPATKNLSIIFRTVVNATQERISWLLYQQHKYVAGAEPLNGLNGIIALHRVHANR